jgi:hypothetical protein
MEPVARNVSDPVQHATMVPAPAAFRAPPVEISRAVVVVAPLPNAAAPRPAVAEAPVSLPTQPENASEATRRSACGPFCARDESSDSQDECDSTVDDCESSRGRKRGGSVAKLVGDTDSVLFNEPLAPAPFCLCIPRQLRFSIYTTLADPSSSTTAYCISLLVTALIMISCVTFCLETMPEYRIASEVLGQPLPVFGLIEVIAISVFTIEYVLRLCTYSSVPREEDADSKLLLFEAKMLDELEQSVHLADDDEQDSDSSPRSSHRSRASKVVQATQIVAGQSATTGRARRASLAGAGALARQQGGASAVQDARMGTAKRASLRFHGHKPGASPQVEGGASKGAKSPGLNFFSIEPNSNGQSNPSLPSRPANPSQGSSFRASTQTRPVLGAHREQEAFHSHEASHQLLSDGKSGSSSWRLDHTEPQSSNTPVHSFHEHELHMAARDPVDSMPHDHTAVSHPSSPSELSSGEDQDQDFLKLDQAIVGMPSDAQLPQSFAVSAVPELPSQLPADQTSPLTDMVHVRGGRKKGRSSAGILAGGSEGERDGPLGAIGPHAARLASSAAVLGVNKGSHSDSAPLGDVGDGTALSNAVSGVLERGISGQVSGAGSDAVPAGASSRRLGAPPMMLKESWVQPHDAVERAVQEAGSDLPASQESSSAPRRPVPPKRLSAEHSPPPPPPKRSSVPAQSLTEAPLGESLRSVLEERGGDHVAALPDLDRRPKERSQSGAVDSAEDSSTFRTHNSWSAGSKQEPGLKMTLSGNELKLSTPRPVRYLKPAKSIRLVNGKRPIPGQLTEMVRMRQDAARRSRNASEGDGQVPPGRSESISSNRDHPVDGKAIHDEETDPRPRSESWLRMRSSARVTPAERGPYPSTQSHQSRAWLLKESSGDDQSPLWSSSSSWWWSKCCEWCNRPRLRRFPSTWSLDEQAVEEEARQLNELRERANAETCSRWLVIELHRVWSFVIQPLNIIDLVAILPFYVELLAAGTGNGGLTVLRILRLGRVFRVFKLGKFSSTMQLIARVMFASMDALTIVLFFVFLGVILFGSLLWIAEGGTYDEATGAFLRPDEYGEGLERTPFESIPATAWFVVVTVTTLGYGDVTPTSVWGKVVAACLAHIGVLVLALPVTILGANFAYYYSQDERERKDAENEKRRSEEGFEDDLSDLYSQAGAMDRLEFRDAEMEGMGDSYDAENELGPVFGMGMDDVPKWQHRQAAFWPVLPGGYVVKKRMFIYNPYIQDDSFADAIVESLANEVEQRLADLRRDAERRVWAAKGRHQLQADAKARRGEDGTSLFVQKGREETQAVALRKQRRRSSLGQKEDRVTLGNAARVGKKHAPPPTSPTGMVDASSNFQTAEARIAAARMGGSGPPKDRAMMRPRAERGALKDSISDQADLGVVHPRQMPMTDSIALQQGRSFWQDGSSISPGASPPGSRRIISAVGHDHDWRDATEPLEHDRDLYAKVAEEFGSHPDSDSGGRLFGRDELTALRDLGSSSRGGLKSTASTMGVSREIRTVVKQVVRALRSDGPTQEVAELRRQVSQTQSDLRLAIREMRMLASRISRLQQTSPTSPSREATDK